MGCAGSRFDDYEDNYIGRHPRAGTRGRRYSYSNYDDFRSNHLKIHRRIRDRERMYPVHPPSSYKRRGEGNIYFAPRGYDYDY